MIRTKAYERMMGKDKLVSVIIPTFNSMTGTKNVEKTLRSVLHQTYRNVEILVIDNFSNDNTGNACASYPVRFYLLRGSRSKARNFGIERMRGAYALFVDSDHVLTQTVIDDCVSVAEFSHADCAIIPISFVSQRPVRFDCSQMRNIDFRLGLGYRSFMLFFSRQMLQTARFPESVELYEDAIFASRALGTGAKIATVRSIICHNEDGSIRNLILRSWNYGRKFHSTIATMGFRESASLSLDVSPFGYRRLIEFLKVVTTSQNPYKTAVSYFLYALLKHVSFAMSFFLSTVERHIPRVTGNVSAGSLANE